MRPEDFEEERRLMYVACTRAMHRLVLTYTGDPSPCCRERQGRSKREEAP